MSDETSLRRKVISNLSLEGQIRLSYGAAIVFAALVVGVYARCFASASGMKFTSDPAAWGQFGDYIGGLLNPMMAALAFYWLTQSVRIQQRELSDTRDAVQKSATAQRDQAIHAEQAAKINALSALLSGTEPVLQGLRQQEAHIHEKFEGAVRKATNMFGISATEDRVMSDSDVRRFQEKLEAKRSEIRAELGNRDRLIRALQQHISPTTGLVADVSAAPSTD